MPREGWATGLFLSGWQYLLVIFRCLWVGVSQQWVGVSQWINLMVSVTRQQA